MNERRRVVVTGMGAMTSLGLTLEETWEGLLAGRSGIGPITQFDASGLPVRIAGELKGFDPAQYINFKAARRMARCSQVTVATAQAALADAGLSLPLPDEERVGVLIGCGAGGLDRAIEGVDTFRAKGLARVNPFVITSSLINMPSHHVSHWAGAKGPISTVVASCATGTQAVGEATEFIRRGAADVMICGGVEALIHFAPIAGFCAMRVLSTRNDEPERASRPFDADRDGFVYSEGCAIFVLEALDHAQMRGARIRAEVLGHASSSDAFHVAQPDPEGGGAIRAMRWALEDAGLTPADVDYINAHGSSTPISDPIETLAIKRVFGERAYRIPINSTKSMIGHAMGGAGAIETAVCVLTIEQGMIHPTINLETPDPECDLDYVPEGARKADVRVALNNSFGLGGQNACLVLGRFEE
ncbi:MAG: beta-ketoacyl-[acyl-carrier-protein] synthase II [Chloroflexi bacterium]|nr:MAG: beta-ketoacyl-[acyl-carrier-protein] synthase II [Chloroflexota bacterium]RLC89191.1 MAG: beta-ketoacyl-[acyl-carrier-protein] synthase II [Chloroflexota bacterium]